MATSEARSSNYVLFLKTVCATASLSTSTMLNLIQAGHGPWLIKPSKRRIDIRCCHSSRWLAVRG